MSDSLQPHGLGNIPGFPVVYYLPEFAQIYVHWICDAEIHWALYSESEKAMENPIDGGA